MLLNIFSCTHSYIFFGEVSVISLFIFLIGLCNGLNIVVSSETHVEN